MAEYSAMKVPELKKLLSEKGLSQTGNKADLIARLQEADNATSKPESKEDEISYSDDEKPAPAGINTEAAKPAQQESTSTGGNVAADEAASAANATTTATTDGEAASGPATTDAPSQAEGDAQTAPPPSFAMGLSSSTADEEAKKRADRAKRFGMEEEDGDDAKKRADRAQRFGLDDKELASGLDSALPERPLKRGRGRHGNDGSNRPGKRQSLDRRGGRGGGGGRQGGGDRGQSQQQARKAGIMDDPAEKAKAEKRAARFASA